MTRHTFVFRDTCAICDDELPFGSYHCKECARQHRVCIMCEQSLEGLGSRAIYHSNSCKSTADKKRREAPPIDGQLTVNSEGLLQVIAQNTGMTLTQIEDMTKAINRLTDALEREPRNVGISSSGPADYSDLEELVEVESASSSGVDAAMNLINSLQRMASLTREGGGTIVHKGPKQMSVSEINTAPDEFNFDLDLEIKETGD